jgi:hypothetical protein
MLAAELLMTNGEDSAASELSDVGTRWIQLSSDGTVGNAYRWLIWLHLKRHGDQYRAEGIRSEIKS